MRRWTRILTAAAFLGLAGLPPLLIAGGAIAPADGERQGGETIEEATGIWALPYAGDGTTQGYLNDYDEECPDPSTSPDVVYYFTNDYHDAFTVDLCDSDYDTKVYVYWIDFQSVPPETVLVGCNDDHSCDGGRTLQSRLTIDASYWTSYYIVIDGGNGESGSYNIMLFDTQDDGACCLPTGECVLTTQEGCTGEWLGPETTCTPNPCVPTPTATGTWGAIKGRFWDQ